MFDGEKNPLNTVSVKICNENVSVYSEDGPDHIKRMANYINYIIDEFNDKKGRNVPHKILLIYAALDLCNNLLRERDSKMSPKERDFEKMFHMEVFNHKKTQDTLALLEKRLSDTEERLRAAEKDIDELLSSDLSSGGLGESEK